MHQMRKWSAWSDLAAAGRKTGHVFLLKPKFISGRNLVKMQINSLLKQIVSIHNSCGCKVS